MPASPSAAGPQPAPPPVVGVVDVGSNSFRMVIARLVGDDVQPIDRLREGVRLAAYLDGDGVLSEEGTLRAVECLERFGQRVRELPPQAVRAVGTNTLRKAKNRAAFLARADAALGHPIEVVSGQEEARLIFLGVSHSTAGAERRSLVVDIGGGSTEVIVGESFEPIRAESLYMGCVGFTERFFPGGTIHPKAMAEAELAARLELRSIRREYRRLGWERALGASGTIASVGSILRESGWSDGAITPDGLKKLQKAVLAVDKLDALTLPGLSKDRVRVLPGGLAILSAVFRAFELERMAVSTGAMTEGVLYDLLGRIRHEDARERTIARFVEIYRLDVAHARRVEATALELFDQVAQAWALEPERSRHLLAWAARLHEIGLAVAHSGYHKHGAYLLASSDMPGFSLQTQRILAALVRAHRRKLAREHFAELPKEQQEPTLRLAVLLRLAFVLNRSRSDRVLPPIQLDVSQKRLDLAFPPGYLDEHPLTRADLDQEAGFLAAVGWKLRATA